MQQVVKMLFKAQTELFSMAQRLQGLDLVEAQRAMRIHQELAQTLALLEKETKTLPKGVNNE
ncbi:hypothetical protein HHJ81_03615 [Mobiluncus mulieris]|uniref:Uncharacterized protein n=1 Tax=Mobiluncus mulieris TaxID=2052 RepID=A0A7Y0Y1I9_9ACTO|nr:hypothetical protein [Mobiluncus mulieris]MCU9995389.1 hypothetical protein [Mobiluncus mulieris]NMW60191.1 hypothetical protein [Mobiluncus mulieris]NMW64453.1 hypothetical protein [Mobiluncus mulieris]NMX11136.1 hypothetical protein [Mobiluncus mulieris]